jgi:hypothetical protein
MYKAQSTSTKDKVQRTKYKAQSTKHSVQCAMYKVQNVKLCRKNKFPWSFTLDVRFGEVRSSSYLTGDNVEQIITIAVVDWLVVLVVVMVNETWRIWNNLGRFIGNLDIETFGSILSLIYLKQCRLVLSLSKLETECKLGATGQSWTVNVYSLILPSSSFFSWGNTLSMGPLGQGILPGTQSTAVVVNSDRGEQMLMATSNNNLSELAEGWSKGAKPWSGKECLGRQVRFPVVNMKGGGRLSKVFSLYTCFSSPVDRWSLLYPPLAAIQ